MYRSSQYVIFTSCNLVVLCRIILYCNVGWGVKDGAVHRSRQQWFVAKWLGLGPRNVFFFSSGLKLKWQTPLCCSPGTLQYDIHNVRTTVHDIMMMYSKERYMENLYLLKWVMVLMEEAVRVNTKLSNLLLHLPLLFLPTPRESHCCTVVQSHIIWLELPSSLAVEDTIPPVPVRRRHVLSGKDTGSTSFEGKLCPNSTCMYLPIHNWGKPEWATQPSN